VIAVTGATGQLGTAFRKLVGDGAVCLSRDDLDLSRPDTVGAVVERLGATVLVNCAAYTAVDRAESERELARSVNALSVEEMAAACRRAGTTFVTFSTDYVFDGTKPDPYVESDATHPVNAYGATKREGEELALRANPDALVIRTSWVLSGTHPNFAATMLRLVRERRLRVVDDQRGHPTLVDDLAPATLAAIEAGATGVLHLTNQGVVSWFELARRVVVIAGLDPERIEPCSTEEYPTPARRPANSVLGSERLDELGLDPLPHFASGLERAVAARQAAQG
jgi:dTDP-4-dehydrorhamnose reductase